MGSGAGSPTGSGAGSPTGSGAGSPTGSSTAATRVQLRVIAREWARIGCIGFGGPPAHISLLRKLCVERRQWLSADEFEDGVATTNLLPGPASTQLAIFCAWRIGGPAGAIIGGACFIVPGLIVILGLSLLFLAAHPPLWVDGAAAGAGAAVPAVALQAALGLAPASWRRATSPPGAVDAGQPPSPPVSRKLSGWPARRWIVYLVVGSVAGALTGPFLVLVLAACGLAELVARNRIIRTQINPIQIIRKRRNLSAVMPVAPVVPAALAGIVARMARMARLGLAAPVAVGGLLSVAWVAFKVGALSYGGGFVIIPLMQHDVVHTYHWMTGAQFLSAVALGQVTPGPVVQTVAVVGYAAAGVGGGLLASFVAFLPSFLFVLVGAPRFGLLRRNADVQAFLTGAGPAAIGAIAGSTIPLALELAHLWQLALLGIDLIWLLALRKNVVAAIVGAAGLGVLAVLAGAPAG
jgi:chromate transporter